MSLRGVWRRLFRAAFSPSRSPDFAFSAADLRRVFLTLLIFLSLLVGLAPQAGAQDTTAPTVTISGVPATSMSAFRAIFTFSESVTGFTVDDITVVNGAASEFTESTEGTVWTALIVPTDAGAVTVDVAADVANDLAGHGNLAATRASSTYTVPTPPPLFGSALVQNINQGELGGGGISTPWAQAFDTGAESGGYRLSSVDARVRSRQSRSTVVRIREDSSGRPGNLVATLVNPGSFTGDDNINTFRAPANTTLKPNTTYWLVLNDGRSDLVSQSYSSTVSDNETGASGWSIANQSYQWFQGAWKQLANVPSFAIQGDVLPSTAGVTLTPGNLALTELHATDSEKTYTVALDTDPGSGVTVTVTPSADNAAVTFSPPSLSFIGGGGGLGGNWGTPQTVTVSAVNDDNTVSETVTISHATTASDNTAPYHGISTGTVTVAVTDAGHGVVVSPQTLDVPNRDGTATYMLRLASDPGGAVVITPTSTTPAVATVRGAVRFDSTDWQDGKTVTVTGKGATAATTSITHTVTTATTNYPSNLSIPPVAVTLVAPPGVTVTETGTPDADTVVTEAFGETNTDTYTVVLDTEPSADVTVTVTAPSGLLVDGPDSDPAGSATEMLTFTTGTTGNWNAAQMVTVFGVDDALDQGSGRTLTITHTAASTDTDYQGIDIANVEVTLVDDDVPEISIAPKTTSVVEGTAAVFTVTANHAPMEALAVNLDVADDAVSDFVLAENEGSGKTVTIAAGETSADYTVSTVGGAGETADEPNGAVTVTVAASGETPATYTVSASAGADTVTVTDDDATVVTLAGAVGDVTEGEDKAFTVALARGLRNGESLAVPLTFGGTAGRGTDYMTDCPTVLPTGVTCANLDSGSATVTFTGPATGVTATTVTLTLSAVTDRTAESGGETVEIDLGTLNASSGAGLGGGASGTDNLADFRITEDTIAPTVTISGVPAMSMSAFRATFTFSESVVGFTVDNIMVGNGAAAEFTGPSRGTVWTALIVPTAAGVVTVDVNADVAHNSDGAGNMAATQARSTYTVPTPPPPFGSALVGNINEDLHLLYASAPWAQSFRTGAESGGYRLSSVNVRVKTVGSANTVVRIREDNIGLPGNLVATLVNPGSFTGGGAINTFRAPANTTLKPNTTYWLVLNDGRGASNHRTNNLHYSATSSDSETGASGWRIDNQSYLWIPRDSQFTIRPGETPVFAIQGDVLPSTAAVTLTPGNLALTELHATDSEKTYTVALDTDPGSGVTVTVTPSADNAAVTFSPPSLSFTGGGGGLGGNWGTPQTVTVSAVNDNNTANETVIISHATTASGDTAPYHGISTGTVTVAVTDAGHGVVVSPQTLDVPNRDGTATYTLRLASDPGGAVVITPTSTTPAVATVRGAVSFDATDWQSGKTVTVTGKGATGATTSITHTVTTATTNYPSNLSIAPVAVTLVAPPEVVVSLARVDSGDITEGGADHIAEFTVSLDRELVADEVLTVPLFVTGDNILDSDVTFRAKTGAGLNTEITFDRASLSGRKPDITFETGSRVATLELLANDDITTEGDETLTLSLGSDEQIDAGLSINVDGDPHATQNSFSLDIKDNDTTEVDYSLAVAPTRVAEQALDGGAAVTLTLTPENATFPGARRTTSSNTPGGGLKNYGQVLSSGQLSDTGKSLITLVGAPQGLTIDDVRLLTRQSGMHGMPSSLSHRSAEIDLVYSGSSLSADAPVTVRVDRELLRYLGQDGVTPKLGKWDDRFLLRTATHLTADFTIGVDERGLTLTSDSLTVAEGGTGTYTVALATQPTGDVTVTIAGAGDVTVDTDAVTNGVQNTLTFSPTEAANLWSTAQMVTVSAAPDADVTDDEATLTHTASGGGYEGLTAELVVTVTDDDVPEISIAGGSAVTEGGGAVFTVTANHAPMEALVVNLEVADDAISDFVLTADEGTGAGKTVTIAAGETSADYTVSTVGGAVETADEPNGAVTVTVAASTDDPATYTVSSSAGADVVTVTDDDATVVTLAGPSGDIEEGQDKTFTVTLSRGLRNGESLAVPLDFGGTAMRGTDYTTVCPTPLPTGVTCAGLDSGSATVTFTGPATGVTATAVTLTLSAVTDRTAESGGETVEIDLGTLNASSGAGLGGGASGTDSLADFRITEDTIAPTVTISGVPATSMSAFRAIFTFSERVTGFALGDITVGNGAASEFTESTAGTVWTALIVPTVAGAVTVDVAAGVADDLAGNGNLAATRASSTYMVPVPPPLFGSALVQNIGQGLDGGGSNTSPWAQSFRTGAESGGYRLSSVDVRVRSIFRPDTASTVVRIRENNSSGRPGNLVATLVNPGSFTSGGHHPINTFRAPANTTLQPNTTYWLVLNDGRAGSDNLGYAFTASDHDSGASGWSIANQSYLWLSGGWSPRAHQTPSFAIKGDVLTSTAGVTLTPANLALTELHATDSEKTYTVALATDPGSGVTVTVTPGADNAAVAFSPPSLSFTGGGGGLGGNWGTPQTVTVSAVNDNNAVSEMVTISHATTASGNTAPYHGISTGTVVVSVTDAGHNVIVSPQTLDVPNHDGTATYTMRLSSDPGATVVITPTSPAPVVATVSGAVSFDATDWQNEKTVTVTGKGATAATTSITHAVTTAATNYPANLSIPPVAVTLTNNAPPGVTVTESGTPDADTVVTEVAGDDNTDTYTVVLNTEPTHDVTVTVTAPAGLLVDGPDSAPAGSATETLTFTPLTWDEAQMVTVFGVDDALDQGTGRTLTITHAAASTDTVYHGIDIDAVEVTLIDDDVPQVTIAPTAAAAVTEGTAASYTLTASLAPASDLTVNLSVADAANADYVATANEGDQTATIAAGATTVVYTVATVDDTGANADEPDGEVTVTVAVSTKEPADYTVGTTDEASVMVEDDDATVVTLAVPDASATEGNNSATARLTLTLGRALFAGESLVVPIGFDGGALGTDFTLALSGTPAGIALAANTGVVTFTGRAGGSATVAPILLTALADSNTIDDTVTVSIPSSVTRDDPTDLTEPILTATNLSGGASGNRVGNGEITLSDSSTPGVTVTETAGGTSVTEASGDGNTDTYTVVLDTEPSHPVMVTVTAPAGLMIDGPDLATAQASTETLTFTTTNWSTAQTVTVFGVDDSLDQGSGRELTIEHTAASTDTNYNGNAIEIADVEVTLVDDDTVGLTLTPTALSVTEGGSETYTVALATEPTATVTVTVTAGAGDVTVNKTGGAVGSIQTLTFTTGDWSTAQTVTVAAAEDDDSVNDTVTLTHEAASGGYDSVSADLTVTVTDTDTPGVTVTETAGGTSVTEVSGGGNTDTYTVVLNTEPTHEVRVTVMAPAGLMVDGPDVAVAQTSTETLTFTTTNWDTAQTVTVFGVDDDLDQGTGRTLTITHTAASTDTDYNGNAIEIADVEVTLVDDDVPEVTIAPKSAGAVTEGTAAVFVVTADPVPASALTVNLTVADAPNSDFVLAANQGAGKTVVIPTTGSVEYPVATVGGGSETTDEPDGEVTVTVTSGSGYTVATSDEAGVEVTDDDATTVTLTTPDTTAMEEDGEATASARLTLGRALRAGESLAVPLQFSGGTVGTDFTLALSGTATGVGLAATTGVVTFTGRAAGSATVATVLLSASADDDAVNDTVTVSIPAVSTGNGVILTATGLSGGATGRRTGNGQITVTDDDTAALTLAPTSLTVTEGASGMYTVKLATRPTATVTVTVTASAGDVTVSGGSQTLTFTTTNWNTAQTVTVAAGPDDDSANDTVTLTHEAAGGDYGLVSAELTVTVTDNDTPGVTVAETGTPVADTEVTEASGDGNTDTYTLVLNTEPTHDVTVTVTAPSGLRVDTDSEMNGAQNTLTFTPTNWDTAQTVTVFGVDDRVDQGTNRTLTITHTAASTDTDYDGNAIVIDGVEVTLVDDDTAGFTLDPTSLTVAEGASGSYTVALTSQPTAPVTVTIAEAGDVTVDTDSGTAGNQRTLTFSPTVTATLWSTARTVTVTAGQDSDVADDAVTLRHTASGGGYDLTGDVEVEVTDDDVPAVTIAGGAAVTEGSEAVFTVTATPVPAAELVVNLEVSDAAGSDFVLSANEGAGKSVTIPVSGSATYRVATVNDVGVDEPDGAVTVAVAASTGNPVTYTLGATTSASVSVSDNDATVVTLAVPDASATEGNNSATARLTLTLGRALLAGESLVVPIGFDGGALGTDFTLALSGTPAGVALAANTGVVTFTGRAGGSATVAPILLTALSDSNTVDDTVTVSIPSSVTRDDPTDLTEPILTATGLSGGASGNRVGNGEITLSDSSTPGVTVTETAGGTSVTEASGDGNTDTYTVVLDTEPSHPVMVTVTVPAGLMIDGPDLATAQASTETLTFTTTNWSTAQTVTVFGVDDSLDQGSGRELTIEHTAASTDTNYNGNAIEIADVEVTLVDDDVPQVTIAPKSAGAVTEGAAAVFVVTANPVPASALTVNLNVADAANADFVSAANQGAGKTVVIPPSGSVEYPVATVGGVSETTDEPDGAVTVTVTSGSGYTVSSSDEEASVSVRDNDATGVTLEVTDSTATEGSTTATATLTLTLGRALRTDEFLSVPLQFAGGVLGTDFQVSRVGAPRGVALLSGNLVTFTGGSSGSATVATIRLTALSDDDAANDTVTVSIPSTTGGGLTGINLSGGVRGARVGNGQITVTDTDTAALTLTPTALTVTEGGSGTYTVKLATRPTAPATVTVMAPAGLLVDGPDMDTTGTRTEALTFTTTNWNTARMVTVTAADDDDSDDDTLTLTHAASGGEYGSVMGDLVVTVTDDDTPGVTVAESGTPVADTEVTEASGDGNTDTYTLVLNTEPTHDVTVTVTAPSGLRVDTDSEMNGAQNTLTFTPTNWDTAQTVTVYGVDDDVDQATDRTLTITHAASSTDTDYNGNAIAIADVEVTLVDDDTAGLTLTPTALAVTEDMSKTYTIALATEPSANVTVTVTAGAGDVTVNKAGGMAGNSQTLTFTTGNWSTAQTVTVIAGEDDDSVNDTVTLMHEAASGGYDSVSADLTVTVTDNDRPGVTITQTGTPPATVVTEASGTTNTDTYTVVLVTQPAHAVTVTVTAPSGLRVDTDLVTNGAQNTLTFTTGNWSTAKTVTVTAVDDQVDQGTDRTLTITHAASSTDTDYHGDAIAIADVEVTVTDNDTAGLTLTPASLTVAEGASGSYTVALTSQPTAPVTVTIAEDGDVTVDTDSGTAGNQRTLTFSPTVTATLWSTARTVTVAAGPDSDVADDEVTLMHTASGGGYGSVTGDVEVEVTDDDVPEVSIAPKTTPVIEGSAAVFTVTANPVPAANLVVNLTVADAANSDFILAANEGVGKIVTIPVSGTAEYSVPTQGGSSETTDEPNGDVTATITANSAYTVSSSAGAAAVRVNDNDATEVTLEVTDTTATEEDGTKIATLMLTLGRVLRAGEVLAVPLQFAGGTLGTDFDLSLSSASGVTLSSNIVTFTGRAGGSARMATIELAASADADAVNDSVTVSIPAGSTGNAPRLTATGLGGGATGSRVGNGVITVTDNDTAGLTLSPTALAVTEGGTNTYTVKLATRPSANVTVTVTADPGDVTVNKTVGTPGASQALTFTTTNWNTAQTVTVIAGEDDDAANDTVTLTHMASGGDYGSVTQDLTVTVTDDDTVGLTLSPTAVTVTEGGTNTYTVKLATEPSANVTVTVTAGADVTVNKTGGTPGNSQALTFTTGNWNTAQTVTVIAGQDTDTAVDTVTLTHTASGGDYGSVTKNLVVTVTDDDIPEVTIAPKSASAVTEGSGAVFTLTASPAPSSALTVNLTVADAANADYVSAANQGSQTVVIPTGGSVDYTVSTDNDSGANADEPDGDVTVTVESGSGYRTGANDEASIPVNDNDATPVTLTTPDTSATEEDSTATATLTLTLGRALRAGEVLAVPLQFAGGVVGTDFTLALSETPTGVALAATTGVVTFTGSDTGSATVATVLLSASADGDAANDTVTVSIPAVSTGNGVILAATNLSGGAVGSRPGNGIIAVTDDDTAGLTLTPTPLTVAEGGSATYTVALSSQPTADVTVTIAGAGDVTVDTDAGTADDQTTLAFTTVNWNTAQTVTVAAGQDADVANDTVTLKHTASGGDYGSVTKDLVVTVTDDDERAVTITPKTTPVTEGSAVVFTVTANPAPTADLTVNLTVADDATSDFVDSSDEGDQTVVIPAGETTADYSVATSDDETDEADGVVTVTVAASSATPATYVVGAPASAEGTVSDDDTATVTLPKIGNNGNGNGNSESLTVEEGSRDVVYTVALDAQPTGDVTVTVTTEAADVTVVAVDGAVVARGWISDTGGGVAGAAGVRGLVQADSLIEVRAPRTLATLTFTPENWSTAQTVVVAVAEDDDTLDHEITLTFTTAGGGYNSVMNLVVTIVDNDEPPTQRSTLPEVSFAQSSGSLSEGESMRPVRVLMSRASETDLTVSYTLTGTARSDDYRVKPVGEIVIPASGTSANLVLEIVDDDIDEPDETIILTIIAGEGYRVGSGPVHTVTVLDNDTAGVELSVSSLHIEASDEPATYQVRLLSEPVSEVTVAVTADEDGIVAVRPERLVFTPQNWSARQTVRVTAVADGQVTLEHRVTSTDPNYNTESLMQKLPVKVTGFLTTAVSSWLVRFARSHVDQILEGIAGRMEATPTGGLQRQLAGRSMGAAEELKPWGAEDKDEDSAMDWKTMTRREMLTGSSFIESAEPGPDGSVWSVWGQGAWSGFDGREGALSVDGEVTTGLLGLDRYQDSWRAGVVLSHSVGEGDYRREGGDSGEMEASLTSLTPWASRDVTDRITAWGAIGYGQGSLERIGEGAIQTDTAAVMFAAGARGSLIEAPSGVGFSLDVVSDALWLRATSDTAGEQDALGATSSDISRLRFGLEGSQPWMVADIAVIDTHLELGVRHDGGDAETGFGVELGGGIKWSDSVRGLNFGIEGRSLVSHDAEGYRDFGASFTVDWDPSPDSKRGWLLNLRQDWGGSSSGGMSRLLEPEHMADGDGAGGDSARRLKVDTSWGLPMFMGRYIGSPYLGYGWSDSGSDYRLGWRLESMKARYLDMSLDIGVIRKESGGEGDYRMGIELKFSR